MWTSTCCARCVLQPRKHALVAAGWICLTALVRRADMAQTQWPWLWPVAILLQGFHLLGFTILLHEQVHDIVRGQPRLNAALGVLYAAPCAMSPTQFRHWHLDHNELRSDTLDPKRANLSPRRNARWLKLAYLTPALFPIYFRGAAERFRPIPRGAGPHRSGAPGHDFAAPDHPDHPLGCGGLVVGGAGAPRAAALRIPRGLCHQPAGGSTTGSTPTTRRSGHPGWTAIRSGAGSFSGRTTISSTTIIRGCPATTSRASTGPRCAPSSRLRHPKPDLQAAPHPMVRGQ